MKRLLIASALLLGAASPAHALCDRVEQEARADALEFAALSCQARLKIHQDTRSTECFTVQEFAADEIALCGRQALTLATIAEANGKLLPKHSEDASYWAGLLGKVNSAQRETSAAASTLGIAFTVKPSVSESTLKAIEASAKTAEAFASK